MFYDLKSHSRCGAEQQYYSGIGDHVTQFNIAISNCNSVDRAEVVLTKGTLNIKYGPNGLGKSTLAKAIVSKIRGDGNLQDLVPFKHRGNVEAAPPKVEGIDDLASALVFDDDYVQQFVFQKDEVLKNSFDIFIKTRNTSPRWKPSTPYC